MRGKILWKWRERTFSIVEIAVATSPQSEERNVDEIETRLDGSPGNSSK
jgi:hypothetical protein